MSDESFRLFVSNSILFNPLPAGPDSLRASIATHRLVESLLWLGHVTINYIREACRDREDNFLHSMKRGIRTSVSCVAVVCQAYGLDLEQVMDQAKRMQTPAIEREAQLTSLQEALFDQCCSYSHVFSLARVQAFASKDVSEVARPVSATWHTLVDLAAWCGAELSALF